MQYWTTANNTLRKLNGRTNSLIHIIILIIIIYYVYIIVGTRYVYEHFFSTRKTDSDILVLWMCIICFFLLSYVCGQWVFVNVYVYTCVLTNIFMCIWIYANTNIWCYQDHIAIFIRRYMVKNTHISFCKRS